MRPGPEGRDFSAVFMGLKGLRKDFWYTTGIAGRTVAGAEARSFFMGFFGTTEVMPCYRTFRNFMGISFSPRCGVVAR